MSIKQQTMYKLKCNRQGCEAETELAADLATAANVAIDLGWEVTFHGDFCPQHRPTRSIMWTAGTTALLEARG